MIQTRPSRGGFLRAFGCAQFIIPFLKGEGPYGSALIDPKRGAPQADIIREYKEALRRDLAGDMVAKEIERRIEANQTPMSDEEEDILLSYFIERLPLRSTKMRYHSFLVYFGMLKRLGWVEPTGEEEFSEAQEAMSAGPQKAPVRVPAPKPSAGRASVLAEKWSKSKKRNSAQALKDLESLPAEYDTEECKAALTDYRDLDRADYEDAEEYKEARDEAWQRFLECLEDLVAEEEGMEEEEEAPPPPRVPKATSKTSREMGQPRIYYRVTAAGRRASEDLIADPIQALYNYPREKRSARPKRFPMRRPKRKG